MTEEKINKLALAMVIGCYLSIGALVAWRLFRKTAPKKTEQEQAGPESTPAPAGPLLLRAPEPDENLESLSHSTPGNALLDKLAARAQAEERGEARREYLAGLEQMRKKAQEPKPSPPPPATDSAPNRPENGESAEAANLESAMNSVKEGQAQ